MAGKKSFIWNFLTAISMLGFLGLSACSKPNTVNATADASNIKGEGQASGCAADQLKNDKLCQLVPVELKGEIKLGSWQILPKGTVKNEFNQEGQLKKSTLFSEAQPDLTLIETKYSYDTQGGVIGRYVSADMNFDGVFDAFEDVKIGTDREDILRYFHVPNAPDQAIVKNFSHQSAISLPPSMARVRNIAVTGWNGSIYFVEYLDLVTENSKVSEANYDFIDCAQLGNCDLNNLPVKTSLHVTTKYDPYTDVPRVSYTKIDMNSDGSIEDQITCTLDYETGNAAILFFPDELKKAGFPEKPLRSLTCIDQNQLKTEFIMTWQPLWQAAGLAEPAAAGSGVL